MPRMGYVTEPDEKQILEYYLRQGKMAELCEKGFANQKDLEFGDVSLQAASREVLSEGHWTHNAQNLYLLTMIFACKGDDPNINNVLGEMLEVIYQRPDNAKKDTPGNRIAPNDVLLEFRDKLHQYVPYDENIAALHDYMDFCIQLNTPVIQKNNLNYSVNEPSIEQKRQTHDVDMMI